MKDWLRVCQQCGESYDNPRDRGKRKYCSVECAQASTRGRKAPWKKVFGEDNHMWKGESVSYRNLHRWVERHLGKPDKCDDCGEEFNGHKIHWANISGEYKRELLDWKRLCSKCHGKFDTEKRRKVMSYSCICGN